MDKQASRMIMREGKRVVKEAAFRLRSDPGEVLEYYMLCANPLQIAIELITSHSMLKQDR